MLLLTLEKLQLTWQPYSLNPKVPSGQSYFVLKVMFSDIRAKQLLIIFREAMAFNKWFSIIFSKTENR